MSVSFFEVGRATVAGSDSIDIPVAVDVPRSDPAGGATIIFVMVQVPLDYAGAQIATTDDAATDPFYGTCFFADGLNHYAAPSGAIFGLIMNPLTNGVNTIRVQFDTVADFIAAGAWAVTGVLLPAVGPQDIDLLTWFFTWGMTGPFQAAQDLDGSNAGFQVGWFWDSPTGPVHIIKPTGALTDMNWEWAAGALAFYLVSDVSSAVDQLGWTWADAGIADFTQWDINTMLGGSHDFWSLAIGTQEPPAILGPGPSVDGAWGDGGSLFFAGGQGYAFNPGAGPSCTTPVTGAPILHTAIRLSE